MTTTPRILASLPAVALLLACGVESDPAAVELEAHSFANSEWSAPMNIGAPVNSAASEQTPTLSNDGLGLYFSSNRSDGFGGADLWIATRTPSGKEIP